MTEGVGFEYGNFIKETYIDPIRSVLIIDDDYPTLEEILDPDRACKPSKQWESNPEPILQVIDGFRKDNPGRLVDVHDGALSDAKHLHQSDLLVLDYELNDKGQTAIEIVHKVLKNSHFNLILVHSFKEPHDTYKEILFSLIGLDDSISDDQVSAGLEIIQSKEDDYPNANADILSTISLQQYVCFRKYGNSVKGKVLRGCSPFGGFKECCDQIGITSPPNILNVFFQALKSYELNNQDLFASEYIDIVDYNSHETDSPLWIRTPQGFLTFIKKNPENNLLNLLQDALLSWGPTPSRLLLTKLRSVMEDRGVMAEDKVLESVTGHAMFYENVLAQSSDAGKQNLIDLQINRYMGGIGSEVKKEARDFFIRVVKKNTAYEKMYSVDLSNQQVRETALKSYNSYVSCMPKVSGWHLSPGHIIRENASGQLWICLSPSCDLVPGQKKTVGVYGSVGPNRKPFIAVKLFERTDISSRNIQSNSFLFLENEPGKIDQYSIYDGPQTPEFPFSPHWVLFVAENNGRFSEQHPSLVLSKFDSLPTLNRALKLKKIECEIVSQLRYEYALNLVNKLGNDMTRIGLGFLGS